MRCVITVGLTIGLLGGASAPGLAQEDGETNEVQRIEVAEAGVAMTFPASWAVDVEMREREDWGLYDEGLAEDPVTYWSVVYASHDGRPWCDLTWYPSHPLALPAQAARYEASMTPTLVEVERPIEVETVSLAGGESYRFVIYNEPTDDFTTTYLLGADDARYVLRCVGDERAEDDWLAVAETLEVLGATVEDSEEE